MRICVFGAGSLGSAIGGLLARKHEVTIVGRRPHVEAVARGGLRLTGELSEVARISATHTPDLTMAPDLLIMTTKAYNTPDAIAVCSRIVDEGTKVLTLQNGLGNLELLRAWKGDHSFGGTTTMGAALQGDGVVRISGLGRVVVGSDLDPDGASEIADAFTVCGVPSAVKEDIATELWGKAVVNACINPVTAVLRIPNGVLFRSATVSRLLDGVCSECVEIAHAAGAENVPADMIDTVRRVASETAENRSSMLRDVELGRRTEIAQINGMFCKHGLMLGLPIPLNRALVALVESLAIMRKVNIVT